MTKRNDKRKVLEIGNKFQVKEKEKKHKNKFDTERSPSPIKALNYNQEQYLHNLKTKEQIFVLGPAGTGKTWIAATYAADLYRNRKINKIILTKPNVPCGRSLGYFPGSIEKKFAPWTAPIIDALKERLGTAVYDIAIKNSDIEVIPFEVMRGRSWKNSFIILDEAQNTTVQEIKMFLTRSGENCITVINGDISQCDIDQSSGLYKAIVLIRELLLPIPVIEFTFDDIVRSDLCAMWSRAFETRMLPQKNNNKYDIYKDFNGVKPDSWKQFEFNNL